MLARRLGQIALGLHLGQRHVLHIELDLAYLQLVPALERLAVGVGGRRPPGLGQRRHRLLGHVAQPIGIEFGALALVHAGPGPSFCMERSCASSSFDSVMLMNVTTTPSMTFSTVR
jgi:hypothetical protein